LGITIKRDEAPTLKQLTDFLAQRCKALEASARNTPSGVIESNQCKDGQVEGKCSRDRQYCGKENHVIYKCTDYLQLNINDRIKEI